MGHTRTTQKPAKMTAATLRSTKGASKHRRDLINTEITYLRETLPLPESARQRLSQLQVMSLACCYIRKCNYFTRLFGNTRSGETDAPFEFSQAMTGFLLITTREGKLLYISDNVTEYLGHSMVDMMTQGDSLYDIIDKRDHVTVQGELLQPNYTPSVGEEKTFFCRMNVSRSFRRHAGFGDHKMMHVRGHFIQPLLGDHYGSQPVFMATCTPLVTPDVKETTMEHNTLMFQTVHGLDMSYIEIAPNAEFHLGYTDAEMKGKSWYGLLHPADIHEAKEKHNQLVKSSHELGCMLTVRLQTASGDWIWVNMVMHIRQPFVCDNGDPAIVCKNHVISESEAPHFKLQSQLYSSHIARSPEFLGGPSGSSPPHAITTQVVSSEGESMQPQSYTGGQDDQGPVSFLGQINVIPTSQLGDSTSHSSYPGMNTNQSQQQQMMESHQGRTSPQQQQQQQKAQQPLDSKQLLKQLLKRKLEAETECRPIKQQRMSSPEYHDSDSHFGGGLSITGSIITQPMSYQQDMMFGSVGSFGSVMGPVQAGPIYSQLSTIKKEVIIPDSPVPAPAPTPTINPKMATTVIDLQHPMTPMTPESVVSESQDGSFCTQLSVDVNDAAVVPTSMLTPESSPQSSPVHSGIPAQMYDLDNTLSLFDSDIIPATIGQQQQQQKLAKLGQQQKQQQQQQLGNQFPELDLSALDGYFQDMLGGLMPTALVRPTKQHANPQSRIAEIAAALMESSDYQHSNLRPASSRPAPGGTRGTTLNPSAIPVTVEDMDQLAMPASTQQPQAATDSSTSLAQSLTESLMDLVHQHGRENLTLDDITASFMLVPECMGGSNDTTADEALLSFLDSSLSDGAASPLGGDIEFQHLEEFTANSPSHGEVDQLSKAVFDSTL